jgi:hypothetical protein
MRAQPLHGDQLSHVEEEAPPALEAADALIPLVRAAAISGVAEGTLVEHADAGRLQAVQPTGEWRTTRRWLHVYLLNDLGDHRSRPLPSGYVAPEGEPRRKLRHYLVQ